MSSKPSAPKGTGVNGAKLWTEVTAAYVLDAHEEALLREAVRTVDALDVLHEVVAVDGVMIDSPSGPRLHPALVEGRQLKLTLARLLAALRLPDGDEGDESQGRRQRRAGARGVYRVPGGAA